MTASVFTEQQIRFEFARSQWQVEKWDDSSAFLHGIGKLNGELTADPTTGAQRSEGTKAVDFVGIHEGTLYLFEVKDFRTYAAANQFRQERELPLEIGLKVRDTLAGIVGAHARRPQPGSFLAAAVLALQAKRPPVVVAWIAEPLARTARDRRQYAKTASIRTTQLKQRLAWLTQHSWVDDPLEPAVVLPGVRASEVRHPPL